MATGRRAGRDAACNQARQQPDSRRRRPAPAATLRTWPMDADWGLVASRARLTMCGPGQVIDVQLWRPETAGAGHRARIERNPRRAAAEPQQGPVHSAGEISE